MTDVRSSARGRRSALVLCGGRGTRMGREKAGIEFHGEPLVARAVRIVSEIASDVIVAARPGQELPALPSGVRVVRDDVADRGPLGGIAAGLRAASHDPVLTVACDAPWLSARALLVLLDRFDMTSGAGAVVATRDGREEPLLAVYRRTLHAAADRLLAEGRLRPVFLFEDTSVVRVSSEYLRDADPDLATFDDCDTPAELAAAAAKSAGSASGVDDVEIEFHDVARLRAGCGDVRVRATTVAGALAAAARRHPGIVPDVVSVAGLLTPHFRVSVNGGPFCESLDDVVGPGDRLLVISAYAGG